MKVNLVSIGNSKGIRIPRSVIKQCGFGDQIEMRVSDGMVVLAPAQQLREGWDAAFEKMAATGDDADSPFAVAIMTDGDSTDSQAEAYFDDLKICSRPVDVAADEHRYRCAVILSSSEKYPEN